MRKFLAIFFALCLCVGMSGCAQKPTAEPTAEPTITVHLKDGTVLPVTRNELSALKDENEVAYEATYVGCEVEGEVTFSSVHDFTFISGSYSIDTYEGFDLNLKANKEFIASLRKGDRLYFTGVIQDGISVGNIGVTSLRKITTEEQSK